MRFVILASLIAVAAIAPSARAQTPPPPGLTAAPPPTAPPPALPPPAPYWGYDPYGLYNAQAPPRAPSPDDGKPVVKKRPYSSTMIASGVFMTSAGGVSFLVGAMLVGLSRNKIDIYCDG